ncbi:MAG: YIP1 family protein [Tabrizicola sp.]|nr:YIP1 family protein [Tabrizicola sp.]
MSITAEMSHSWKSPRVALRRKLEDGVREDRALAVLMGACFLVFVAQWPVLSRAASLAPDVPLDARMGGALMATIFVLPPVLYGVAAVSHLIARAFGGQGSHYGARLALFWALLCVSPVLLLNGLIAGIVGPGPAVTLVGGLVLAAFLYLWINMLIEAER